MAKKNSSEFQKERGCPSVETKVFAPILWKDTVADIRAMQTYGTDSNMADKSTRYIYRYDPTSNDTDDGINYLKPDNVLTVNDGRWVKILDYGPGNTNSYDDIDIEPNLADDLQLKDGGYLGYYYVRSLNNLDDLITATQAGRWLFSRDIILDANKSIPPGVVLDFQDATITLGDFNLILAADTEIIQGKTKMFNYNGTGYVVWNELNKNKYQFKLGFGEYELIAHRGFASLAPENSLSAISNALVLGADSIEFDVQITSDGVPVVFHDDTMDALTTGTGAIKDDTWANIQTYTYDTYDAKFNTTTICSLEDVLAMIGGRTKNIYPEIKNYRTTADISIMVNKIIEYGMESRTVIQSFNHSDFAHVRAISSQIKLGYLSGVPDESTFNTILNLAANDGNAMLLFYYQSFLDNPSWVATARNKGVDVGTYTVNDSEIIRKLGLIGVNKLMGDSYITGGNFK